MLNRKGFIDSAFSEGEDLWIWANRGEDIALGKRIMWIFYDSENYWTLNHDGQSNHTFTVRSKE